MSRPSFTDALIGPSAAAMAGVGAWLLWRCVQAGAIRFRSADFSRVDDPLQFWIIFGMLAAAVLVFGAFGAIVTWNQLFRSPADRVPPERQ